jgi:uncharacterized protein YijF (DUF1287 family)
MEKLKLPLTRMFTWPIRPVPAFPGCASIPDIMSYKFPHACVAILLALFLAYAPAFAIGFSPERFVQDARTQIGKTLHYDAAYAKLAYPMGDIPIARGVCTDVVIRALRPQGIDLQQRVHEDMKANFRLYPNQSRWKLAKPDPNIDHRRVPNLQRYFQRQGYAVDDAAFLPGDIVTWELQLNVGHIGIVSDKKASSGKHPLIIHNIGHGAQEEDLLYQFKITGHYRISRDEDAARH